MTIIGRNCHDLSIFIKASSPTDFGTGYLWRTDAGLDPQQLGFI